MKFTDFSLVQGLQAGLDEAGYISCMPVQEQVLKNGLEGADLYVQSQTGTGKTAAYLVTILQRLTSDSALLGKKALIMVPTRELAVQVEEEARILAAKLPLKVASFYGGVGYGRQQDQLAKGVDILVGTPGRVIDLQESKTMDLSDLAFLVIDEADRMFDMGFYPDLRTLINFLPKPELRQTMLFSATLNSWVKNLAWEYTREAKEITIEAENITVDEIEQLLFHVSADEKMRLLLGLISKEKPKSLIVFCNTKKMSEIVAKRLKLNKIETEFIIGDLPQSKRLQVIESFKSGSLRCLVATDVAARGIDVNDLEMVINFDLPNEAENYVHRIGRTARAGKSGKAYTLCSEQDVYNLPAIEKYVEKKIPSCVPGEDDFVEDASKGVYIHTDRYDSDYEDEGPSRRTSRGGTARGQRPRPSGSGSNTRSRQNSENRTRGDSGFNERRTADNRVGSGGSRTVTGNRAARGQFSKGESANYQNKNRRNSAYTVEPSQNGHAASGASHEVDLSKLTFEQRMAYYKNKYKAEEGKAPKSNKQGQKPSPKPKQKNTTQQKQRNQGATKSAEAKRTQSKPSFTKEAPLTASTPAPKKSIFNLFNIFKKK